MKYICLDIGNVLCHIDMAPFIGDLAQTFYITTDEATQFLRDSQHLHDLGHTSMEKEMKNHFRSNPALEFNLSRLLKDWNKIAVTSELMLSALNKWRDEHKLQIALLSNIGTEHAALMPELLELDGFFQNAIKHFSCEVGARKPTKLYYQSFLMQYPKFKGCVYVDDLKENLEASKQFGFQPFHLALDSSDVKTRLVELESLVIAKKTTQNSRRH